MLEGNDFTYCQIDSEDFITFCGLLRKHELWIKTFRHFSFLPWTFFCCFLQQDGSSASLHELMPWGLNREIDWGIFSLKCKVYCTISALKANFTELAKKCPKLNAEGHSMCAYLFMESAILIDAFFSINTFVFQRKIQLNWTGLFQEPQDLLFE